ncbi:uncharacterized protein N7459_003399 [Penicillium hispanicum]|uniref:uncharacterized protein n=1 Tax=Penicillium hispanicum TaxID=1080232 RepID=UPI00254226E2|nr:uncharacterized protein N7459_003399 [Penicillium hispanicum]KAJ5587634.1 hypothetical protein N7459_003399 [Penicillium hispanicum]
MSWEKEAAEAWYLPGYGLETEATPHESPSDEAGRELTRTPSPAVTVVRWSGRSDTEQPVAEHEVAGAATPAAQEEPTPRRATLPPASGAAWRERSETRGSHRHTESLERASRLFQDSPAKAQWRQNEEPGGVVRLPAAFGNRRPAQTAGIAQFISLDKGPSGFPGRDEVIDGICRKTGAFIKPSIGNERELHIWGDSSQVLQAQEMLLSLVNKWIESRGAGLPGPWTKIHPYSTEKHEQMQSKKTKNFIREDLRKEPASSNVSSKMLFLWPSEGPSAQEVLGDELEKLDTLREEFNVYLYLHKNIKDCICAASTEDIEMEPIISQLRELWQQAVAKFDIRIKSYMVEPPPLSIMKDGITLVQGDSFAQPFLHGNQIAPLRVPLWQLTMGVIRRSNHQLILSSVRRLLTMINFYSGYLRMRVHFGSFIFDIFRHPSGGKQTFNIEEFQQMIQADQAKGRLVPGLRLQQEELLDRCAGAEHFLEPTNTIQPLSSLKSMRPLYSAKFEFSGKMDSQFRLEVCFDKPIGGLELERSRHRWFKARCGDEEIPRRLPLQLGMIDFARTDWQYDMELFEPLGLGDINSTQAEFVKTVRLTAPMNERLIGAAPFRKVAFSTSIPIAKYVEKAALQFKIKGTDYILELARFDEYTTISPNYSGWTKNPITSWGATLYNLTWDAALGYSSKLDSDSEEALKRAAAQHERGLTAFFPSSKSSESEDDSHGFEEFMKIVSRVSALLGPGQDSSPGSPRKENMTARLDTELGTLF